MPRPRRLRRKRSQFLRALWRDVFWAAITACNHIRSVFGSAPAVDYSKITGGQKAQFKDKALYFTAIDYSVDVLKACQDTLNPEQMTELKNTIVDKVFDHPEVQSPGLVKMAERMGRVFITRRLYPVEKYFKMTAHPNEGKN